MVQRENIPGEEPFEVTRFQNVRFTVSIQQDIAGTDRAVHQMRLFPTDTHETRNLQDDLESVTLRHRLLGGNLPIQTFAGNVGHHVNRMPGHLRRLDDTREIRVVHQTRSLLQLDQKCIRRQRINGHCGSQCFENDLLIPGQTFRQEHFPDIPRAKTLLDPKITLYQTGGNAGHGYRELLTALRADHLMTNHLRVSRYPGATNFALDLKAHNVPCTVPCCPARSLPTVHGIRLR